MKHLAYFVDSTIFGGAEHYLFQVISGIIKTKRYQITLILPPPLMELDVTRNLEGSGGHLQPFLLKGSFDFHGYHGLWKLFRQQKPDLLHINLPSPYSANFSMIALIARLAGIPNIVTTEHLPMVKGKWWVMRFLKGFNTYFIDRIITVSRRNVQYLVEIHRIIPKKIVCIYNGVDLNSILALAEGKSVKLSQIGIRPGERVVLGVGRLHWQKGFEYLVQAAAQVIKSYPDVKFLIAGDGPDHGDLGELIKQLGLNERVILLGFCANIPELIKKSDIFVISSLLEGLPFALLEAMALGKPVIATAIDGIPEVVEDGRTGFLVPVRDATALASRIIQIFADLPLGISMGRLAQNEVLNRFNLQDMLQNTVTLYEAIMKTTEKGK